MFGVVLSSNKNDIVKMPTVCLDQIKFLFTNSLSSTAMKADAVLFMIASSNPSIEKTNSEHNFSLVE